MYFRPIVSIFNSDKNALFRHLALVTDSVEQPYLALGDGGQTVKPKSDYMNKYLSSLDQSRFGIVTVKAEGLESPKDVDECIFFSQHNNAELLIARLDATKLEAAQRIEALGGILSDTLILL